MTEQTSTDPDDYQEDLPTCLLCPRELDAKEARVCGKCFDRVRGQIYDIVDLYGTLPDHIATLTGARLEPGPRSSAERPVVGGDALVMHSAGNGGNTVTSSKRGDRSHALDHWPNDPPSIAAELGRWEDDWRQIRREDAAPTLPTVATAANYLLKHYRWASVSHPAFEEFADDIRHLRTRLRVVTGDIQYPLRADARCFDCGGSIVQKWTDEGLSDTRECDDCGNAYTVQRYLLAARGFIEEQRNVDPEAVVDIKGAREVFPEIPASTIRRWAHEGRLERAAWGERNRALYRLSDITALVTTRQGRESA